ncbi:MAG TPA: hypothetical protein VIO16_01495 [Dehalococcoidia bacterium]
MTWPTLQLFDARDLSAAFALAGLVALTVGLWEVFAPLAFITPGAFFLVLGMWRLRGTPG